MLAHSAMVACRFMHIFIVDCRFALLVVDVDFGQKSIVDCRQKGPKTCDLHLIRTPPHPPPTEITWTVLPASEFTTWTWRPKRMMDHEDSLQDISRQYMSRLRGLQRQEECLSCTAGTCHSIIHFLRRTRDSCSSHNGRNLYHQISPKVRTVVLD